MLVKICSFRGEFDKYESLIRDTFPSNVELFKCDIVNADCEAIVSPANSFGFMDGGIDQHYVDTFGTRIATQVRYLIEHDFDGEMLVGQAEAIPLTVRSRTSS